MSLETAWLRDSTPLVTQAEAPLGPVGGRRESFWTFFCDPRRQGLPGGSFGTSPGIVHLCSFGSSLPLRLEKRNSRILRVPVPHTYAPAWGRPTRHGAAGGGRRGGPRGANRPRKAALKTRAHTFFRPMHPREATHQSSGSHAPPCSVVRFRAPRAGRPAARRSRRPNRGKPAHALTPAPRCVSCSMSCAWLCDWLWPLAGVRSRAAHRCAIHSAEGPHRPVGRRLPRLSQLILFLRVVFLLEVEDGALDLLRVLGAQVKSTRQILQRLGLVAELLVHLA